MIERDFYFAAWAIGRGISHEIKSGAVDLHVDATTMRQLKTEYASTVKRSFDHVKRIVKTISESRKNAKVQP